MATKIELNRAKIALVDDDIADEISIYIWSAYKDRSNGNETWYAKRHLCKNGINVSILMHRFVYELKTGIKLTSNQHIDHLNNNGLDNRFENLRIATASNNAANKIVSNIKKSSKYKGVYWNKEKEKWQVQIQYNYKKYNLGYFYKDEEIEAAEIYDKKALTLFGEYAHINFPEANYVKEIRKPKIEYAVAAAATA